MVIRDHSMLVFGIILLFNNVTGQSLTLTSTTGSGDLCDGESATFTCTKPGGSTIFNWYIFGLNGEGDIGERTARVLSDRPSGRFSTTDVEGDIPKSNLMISNFTTADNGAVIYCIDALNPTVFSSTNITIGVGPFNLMNISFSSGVNSISLSWVCDGSGCRPIQYMIKWSESGVNENQTTTNDTSYTIRGLDGCTNYSVTVETQVCGGHSLTEVIQTVEGVTGKIVAEILPSEGNLEFVVTSLTRNDICSTTPINLTITVTVASDGETFTDTVAFKRLSVNEVYRTNIPVGSSYTAEVCAVTPVGRGQCKIMYKKATTTTGGLSDAEIAGIGVGVALVVVLFIVIGCYYYQKKKKKKSNVGIKGSQERDQEGATHTKVYVDRGAKNEKHGVEYADLDHPEPFDHPEPKPPTLRVRRKRKW